jgi:hypothetical protein
MATVPLFFDILFFTFGADPTRPTSRLLGTAAPRPRSLGKQTSSRPTAFADDPVLRCSRGGLRREPLQTYRRISDTGNLSPPPRVGSTFGSPMQTSWTPGRRGDSLPRLLPWDAAPRFGAQHCPCMVCAANPFKNTGLFGTGNLRPPPRVDSMFGPPIQTSWTPGRRGGTRPRLLPWDAAPRLGAQHCPCMVCGANHFKNTGLFLVQEI